MMDNGWTGIRIRAILGKPNSLCGGLESYTIKVDMESIQLVQSTDTGFAASVSVWFPTKGVSTVSHPKDFPLQDQEAPPINLGLV